MSIIGVRGDFFMKKLIAVILIIGALCTLFLLNTKKDADVYRLHIIANSDSEKDQSVKLHVRDAVLECEKELFAGKEIKTAKQARALLMDNAKKINEAVLNILKEENQSYGVKLSTGIYHFPDRVYRDKCYPEGEYSALRVVLGDGKGENWWCVMFPPLCIIDDTNAQNADENTDNAVEFESIFGDIGKWFASLFNI